MPLVDRYQPLILTTMPDPRSQGLMRFASATENLRAQALIGGGFEDIERAVDVLQEAVDRLERNVERILFGDAPPVF